MKKINIHQTLKYTFVVLLMALFLGITSSCSNDDDDNGTSHKVVFKATASAGSDMDMVTYGYDTTLTTATSLSGTTWTSPEITVPAGAIGVNVGMNAMGADASSTLKVQIFVDGELKKEATATGQALSAHANYNF